MTARFSPPEGRSRQLGSGRCVRRGAHTRGLHQRRSRLPEGNSNESDFALLSDIFPTGHHGTELAMVAPGKTGAVFGAGPVGLLAAYSAMLGGAAQVFVVDKEPDRLALAQKLGATPIEFSKADPTETMMEATKGFGSDCGIECVGFQAHDPSGQEHPELVLDNLVHVVRATRHIGVVGVYVPEDPKAATEGSEARSGSLRLWHRIREGPQHRLGAVSRQEVQP